MYWDLISPLDLFSHPTQNHNRDYYTQEKPQKSLWDFHWSCQTWAERLTDTPIRSNNIIKHSRPTKALSSCVYSADPASDSLQTEWKIHLWIWALHFTNKLRNLIVTALLKAIDPIETLQMGISSIWKLVSPQVKIGNCLHPELYEKKRKSELFTLLKRR